MAAKMFGLSADGKTWIPVRVDASGQVIISNPGGGGGGSVTAGGLGISQWTDSSGAYYVRRDWIDPDTQEAEFNYTTPAGVETTPGAGLKPIGGPDVEDTYTEYTATTAGTGYSIGDIIVRLLSMKVDVSPPTIVSSAYVNLTTAAVITPNIAHLVRSDQNLTVPAIGGIADPAATGDSGPWSLVAIAKRGLARWTSLLALLPSSLGTKADSASLSVALGTQSLAALTQLHVDLTTPVAVLPPRPLRTDVANFPTKTLIEVAGADTDLLLAAGGAGKRVFITGGYLQTDLDVVLTLKSDTTDISETIILKANDALRFECPNDIPEFWSGVNEAINIAKSTAATLRGHLFSVVA